MSGQVNALECYFFFNTPTSFLPTAASRIISLVIHFPSKREIETEFKTEIDKYKYRLVDFWEGKGSPPKTIRTKKGKTRTNAAVWGRYAILSKQHTSVGDHSRSTVTRRGNNNRLLTSMPDKEDTKECTRGSNMYCDLWLPLFLSLGKRTRRWILIPC